MSGIKERAPTIRIIQPFSFSGSASGTPHSVHLLFSTNLLASSHESHDHFRTAGPALPYSLAHHPASYRVLAGAQVFPSAIPTSVLVLFALFSLTLSSLLCTNGETRCRDDITEPVRPMFMVTYANSSPRNTSLHPIVNMLQSMISRRYFNIIAHRRRRGSLAPSRTRDPRAEDPRRCEGTRVSVGVLPSDFILETRFRSACITSASTQLRGRSDVVELVEG